jgi:hypothetical protein
MKFVLAAILVAHGVAHLVGFVSSWQLATLAELPYKTTILAGRLDLGDAGIRVVGALWLIAALGFMVAAFGTGTSATWAVRVTAAAIVTSLVLCVAGWPDSRIGLAVNVALAVVLVVVDRLHLVAALR